MNTRKWSRSAHALAAHELGFAILAHELRQPIHAIRLAADVLEADMPRHSAFAVIRRQLSRMERLLGSVLDSLRLGSGTVKPRLRRLDLGKMVKRTVKETSAAFEGKDLHVAFDWPRQAVVVKADRALLGCALGNLVSNAMRCTAPGGSIQVGLRTQRHRAVVSVKDSGCGIPRSQLPRVFEPFARTTAVEPDGLGLGLAIVGGIVALHGGQVEARSEGEGRGAEFVIRIPA